MMRRLYYKAIQRNQLKLSSMRLAVTLALFTLVKTASGNAPTQIAIDEFRDTYLNQSNLTIISAATSGNVLAQFELGRRLSFGLKGLPRNPSAAANWTNQAKKRGSPGSASLDDLPTVPMHFRFNASVTDSTAPKAIIELIQPFDASTQSASFNASNSTDNEAIAHYFWSTSDSTGKQTLNDAALPNGELVEFQPTLSTPGTYYITLVVMDTSGWTNTTLTELVVPEIPPPDVPASTTPSSDSTLAYSDAIMFTWAANSLAGSYDFELINAVNNESVSEAATTIMLEECGEVICSFTYTPSSALVGDFLWRLRAKNDTGESAWIESSLTINPPKPLTPINQSPAPGASINQNATIAFTWDETEFATEYTLLLDGPINANDVSIANIPVGDICSGGTCSYPAEVNLPVGSSYGWRVQAKNVTGGSSYSRSAFSVIVPITQSPETPELLSPAALAVIETDQTQSFSWTHSPLATSYEIALLAQGNDEHTVFDTTKTVPTQSCSSITCTTTIPIPYSANTTANWHVRAINPAGESDWVSAPFYVVEQQSEAPTLPVITSPIAGADIIANSNTTFSWETVAQASTYEFFFFNNEDGDDRGEVLPYTQNLMPADLCADNLCSYARLVDLPIHENHLWRVRAVNSQGASTWTSTQFNVVAPITNAPEPPLLSEPLANALLEQNASVAFEWGVSELATLYSFSLFNTDNPTEEILSAFVPASNCTNNICSISTTLDELNFVVGDSYEWQVFASNAVGASNNSRQNFILTQQAVAVPGLIENLTPEEGALVYEQTNTTFQWVMDENAVTYQFHLFDKVAGEITSEIEGLLAQNICNDGVCGLSITMPLPIANAHAWRVRGKNSLDVSPAWSRTEIDVVAPVTEAPAAPLLIAPTEGQNLLIGEALAFVWEPTHLAAEYELSIFATATNDTTQPDDSTTDETTDNPTPELNNGVADGIPDWADDVINTNGTTEQPESTPAIYEASLNAGNCSDTRCQLSVAIDLPTANDYLWHISATNPIGTTLSTASVFNIIEPVVEPLTAPTILAPNLNDTLVTNSTVAFQWQAEPQATAYELYFTDALNGPLEVVADLLPETTCEGSICTYTTVIELPVSDQHTWHVRTTKDDELSPWSQSTFAVALPLGSANPIASFLLEGYEAEAAGIAPITVLVDPSGSTDDIAVLNYIWQFGDDEPIQTSNPEPIQHTFSTPGEYTITLTVEDGNELSDTATKTVTVFANPTTITTQIEASRLLAQTSFGPTLDSIAEVQNLGIENWLTRQLTLQRPSHLAYVLEHSGGNESKREFRHEAFWQDAIDGDDQLRQRVAFALSQLFVVSDTGFTLGNAQYGMTNYYDLLRTHAFGNFRQLLEEVTLSPIMGLYLSMLQNAKNDATTNTRADENYAREVLQLFSIGLHTLNIDGTTDGSPVFTQAHIEAFARVFTGWNYADADRWDRKPFTGADVINQMQPWEEYHDKGEKVLLNGAIAPANQSARQDLNFALDNIFNHPNVGPFIAKQLIKKLITSNPSTDYVERVATVFNNNGQGVRGDMEALVRAILLDDEARNPQTNVDHFGKLREPVLRLSHLWRAFNVQPGTQSSARGEYHTTSPELKNLEQTTGQAVLKSPSVFNFFQPSFSPAGPVANQNLVAPEFELFTESNELATSNRIGRQIQEAYLSNDNDNARQNAYLDFSFELSLATNPTALLDHLNVVLLSGNMSDALRTALSDHLNSLSNSKDGLSKRVRDAITLIMSSPDYLVQM